jgi:hypothetical protein
MIDWEWIPRFTILQMFGGMFLTALAMWVVNRALREELWAIAVMLALGWGVGSIVIGILMGAMAWVAGRVLSDEGRAANPFAEGQLPPQQAFPSSNSLE